MFSCLLAAALACSGVWAAAENAADLPAAEETRQGTEDAGPASDEADWTGEAAPFEAPAEEPHLTHVFPSDAWRVRKEATCLEAGEEYNVCAVCGAEITRTVPPRGHSWNVLTLQEPTCTRSGVLVRVCTECGLEDRQETPALGHVFDWVTDERGRREYQCVICGLTVDLEEAEEAPADNILYDCTITSFGPTTRDLIGGTVWNRVTPLDVSETGVHTYPLIASDRYTVGTATVVVEDGWQTVSYELNSDRILVHSESLVFYSDRDALRAGTDGKAYDFNQPISLEDTFGQDTHLIMGITLTADYDSDDPMIRSFSGDDAQIDQMNELLD